MQVIMDIHLLQTSILKSISVKVSANGSYWEDGKWVETKPMEIKRVYNFPEIGERTCIYFFMKNLNP